MIEPQSPVGWAAKRIVICGSMSTHHVMVELQSQLANAKIAAVVPPADAPISDASDEESLRDLKRRLSMQHIRRVRDPKTFGILVTNCDRHGIPDYIGPNTFAEIAIALAHYKQIFLYQGTPAFYEDELTAWGAIALNGSLDKLIEAIGRRTSGYTQPTLFDLF